MELIQFMGFKTALVLSLLAALTLAAPAAAANAPVTHITVLHTNDTHGFLSPFDMEKSLSNGGAAGRATLINEIRHMNEESGPNRHTILLDAGDLLENNPMSNFFKGEPDIEAMNMMGYDAMTFGNHDFGFGMDEFFNIVKKAQFSILSANVLDRRTGNYIFKPYIVKNCGNVRVGIFGLTSHTLFYNSKKADLEKITFLNKDEAYEKIRAELFEKSDIVIFLSHLGVEEEREFAVKHPEVKYIIGGHSHTFLEKPEMVGNTMILQAGKYGECLGRLDITLAAGKIIETKARLINIADRKVNEFVKKYRDQLDPALSVRIGECKATLENMNKFETFTPLFQFILKILREHASADMSMETSASIGGRLNAGPISLKEIYRIMPYNNFVVVIKMKGAEIRQLMDYSVSKKKSNSFIQFYGAGYEEKDGRAANIKIGSRDLDENKIYRVATDNFMSAGGAEDGMLKNIEEGRKEYSEKLIRDVVIEYIKNAKTF